MNVSTTSSTTPLPGPVDQTKRDRALAIAERLRSLEKGANYWSARSVSLERRGYSKLSAEALERANTTLATAKSIDTKLVEMVDTYGSLLGDTTSLTKAHKRLTLSTSLNSEARAKRAHAKDIVDTTRANSQTARAASANAVTRAKAGHYALAKTSIERARTALSHARNGAQNLKELKLSDAMVWQLKHGAATQRSWKLAAHVKRTGELVASRAKQIQPAVSGPLAKLAGMDSVKSIDVSHYQGNINWSAVRKDGVRIAFLKATDGRTYNDPTYKRNLAAAHKAGIAVGAYHFAEPDGGRADAIAEAKHYLAQADLKHVDIVPVLDLETTRLGKAALTAWVDAWTDTVEKATGKQPMIYVSPSFWASHMNTTAEMKQHPIWVANWGVSSPSVPAGFGGWDTWQYTSGGHVKGIAGRVDMDRVRNPLHLALHTR
jgi:lysozyme